MPSLDSRNTWDEAHKTNYNNLISIKIIWNKKSKDDNDVLEFHEDIPKECFNETFHLLTTTLEINKSTELVKTYVLSMG